MDRMPLVIDTSYLTNIEALVPVENCDVLAAIRGFLHQFLESGMVGGLFVPLEAGNGTVIPALVTDPDLLAQANPLLPVMPINNARAVSALTGKKAPTRLGAVLRPCELHALIELVKLQQANLEGLILIGIDCPGTYDLADILASLAGQSFPLPEYLAAAGQGEAFSASLQPRIACQMCLQPIPLQADIRLHLFGVDSSQGIPVTFKDKDLATSLSEQIKLEQATNTNGQTQAVIDKVISARKQVREREMDSIRTQMKANGGIASIFSTCIRCHNCMTACPICYCKTCLFKSAAFDHSPEWYLRAGQRKGAQRMLGDTLLFHMTRLNHMSASCVSCGMCSAACPVDIPVGTIFSVIGEQVQSAFGYLPGRDLSEPLPLITFQADEWVGIGEER